MRKFLVIIGIFIFSIVPAIADIEGQSHALLENTLTDWIIPGYDELHLHADALEKSLSTLCANPSIENLTRAQDNFHNTARSWGHIEWFRVGPVMSDNRLERVLFYPDRKSTGLKQVQRALASKDETAIQTQSLAKKSVAMQGLGALEFLLFGTGHETLKTSDDAYRCQYAKAIGGNLNNITDELVAGWSDDTELRQIWLTPNDENPIFRNDFEALNMLIGTLIHGLEAIRDVRIGAFLKEEPQKDRPKSALFWRSQNTLFLINANIESLNQLLTKSEFLGLLPEESRLSQTINFEFNQSIHTAKALKGPIAELLADDDSRQKLTYLQFTLSTIIDRLNNEFAPALGLKAGFSFGDGD